MTRLTQGRRPAVSALRRGLHLAAAGATLAVASTVAFAQSWEATVTGEAPPAKRAVTPWIAAAASPKAKPVPPPSPVAEPPAQPDGKGPLKAAPVAQTKPEAGSVKGTAVEEYCANIANPAADARFAWQKRALAGMEEEIAKRITALEERTAELQKWLARRDEFSKKANETLLRIYARMRPDAAAVQMAALDEETAAALLIKLEPRTASLILNEMEPNQAVRLTGTISGAAKIAPVTPPKKPPEAKAK